MNKLLIYKAKDAKTGMTAVEIRAALDDAESTGTIITVKSRNGFNGKLYSLTVESVLEDKEDKGAQA